MKNDKILTLLGFASKAGKLCYGFNKSAEALRCGRSFLIIAASDVSPKTQKEAEFSANKVDVDFIKLNRYDITTVSCAVGRKCGILSVNDEGFAEALLKAYVEGGIANDE